LPVLKLKLSLTLNLSKKVNPLYPSAVRKNPSLKIYTNINEPKIFDLLQKNTFMGPPNSMEVVFDQNYCIIVILNPPSALPSHPPPSLLPPSALPSLPPFSH
jgi:hypothetical protein